MKRLLTFTGLLFASTLFGQRMTREQWNEEAKTNIRLLPKYGYAQKTEQQKQSDREFIQTALKQDTTYRKASNHLIALGFRYLYQDIKTAMYRFNQAYLLDSTNTDIYWGFGGVYMTLGDYEKAAEQYIKGLKANPDNTHLLTDYGTYFMTRYYALQATDEKGALTNLENALHYLLRSYQLDPSDQNTTFKLSACFYIKKECENAWKYYNICKESGGKPITEAYTTELQKNCQQKK